MKIGGDTPSQSEKLMMDVYSRPTYFNLYLFEGKSFYKKKEILDNSQKRYVIPVIGEYKIEAILSDYTQKKQIKEVIYARKKFWITDSLNIDLNWEIKNDKMSILGLNCRKAVSKTDNGNIITAWYYPKLPYKMGPANYYGLPGLILKVTSYPESNPENKVEITALKIDETDKKIDLDDFYSQKTIPESELESIMAEHVKKVKAINNNKIDKD